MPSAPIQYGATDTPVGAAFPNRQALRDAGLHCPLQAGIDFAPGQPAASVVLSGVYPDEDRGNVIIYTGQGGQDPTTGKAIADQKPARGNAALFRNRNLGIPVRVLRRVHAGFRYDGLFTVEDYIGRPPGVESSCGTGNRTPRGDIAGPGIQSSPDGADVGGPLANAVPRSVRPTNRRE